MSHFDDLNAHYLSQPHEVSIETQSLCNARCTFCPYPTLERIGNKMPDELLGKLVDEMATFEKPFFFSPFKVNEPFLDKRLIPLCRDFNEKVPKGHIRLFSNGSALTDKHIEDVCSLKRVVHLWISLNEYDPKKYEETMGLNFAITQKRLDRLHEYVDRGQFRHPVVVSRVGMDACFISYVRMRWPRFQPAIIKRDAWIDYTYADTSVVPNTPCARWWELNVTSEGKVVTCCMTSGEDSKYIIGDVKTHTLLEIYNSPRWRNLREKTESRKTVSLEDHPCAKCSY